MIDLTPEKALIFRITHRDNLRWILNNGIHCASAALCDPDFKSIGNVELISRRTTRALPRPYRGTLSDYIPFYFTPHSPMLYNIKTGHNGITRRSNEEVAILVSSLNNVQQDGGVFVFSDRHAYMQTARFSDDLSQLDRIDWEILRRRDFARDPNDPGKMERYQAEALVRGSLPVASVLGVALCNDSSANAAQRIATAADVNVRIIARPGWYFQ